MLKRVMKFMGLITPTVPSSETLVEAAQWCRLPCRSAVMGRRLTAVNVDSYETLVEVLCNDDEWRDLQEYYYIRWNGRGSYEIGARGNETLNIRIRDEYVPNWDYIVLKETEDWQKRTYRLATIIGGVEQPRPH